MDFMTFNQPAGHSAVKFAQALWKKGLCCKPVYDAYGLMETFIGGIRLKVRESVRGRWANKDSASLQKMSFHALSVAIVESGNATPESGKARPERTNTQSFIDRKIMTI